MFKQNLIKCHLETAWPFVLFYLIEFNVVLVSCCTSKQKRKKREIYINIYILA